MSIMKFNWRRVLCLRRQPVTGADVTLQPLQGPKLTQEQREQSPLMRIKARASMAAMARKLEEATVPLLADKQSHEALSDAGHFAAARLDEFWTNLSEAEDALERTDAVHPVMRVACMELRLALRVINETATGAGEVHWVENRITHFAEAIALGSLTRNMASICRQAREIDEQRGAGQSMDLSLTGLTGPRGVLEQDIENLVAVVFSTIVPLADDFEREMRAEDYRRACRTFEYMRYKAAAVVDGCEKDPRVNRLLNHTAGEARARMKLIRDLTMRAGMFGLVPAIEDQMQVTAALELNNKIRSDVREALRRLVGYEEVVAGPRLLSAA